MILLRPVEGMHKQPKQYDAPLTGLPDDTRLGHRCYAWREAKHGHGGGIALEGGSYGADAEGGAEVEGGEMGPVKVLKHVEGALR